MFSIVRPPGFIKKYYNKFIWNIPVQQKEIFLTFDDGPLPGPTEFVLDQLNLHNAKGTFFCVGNNVQKHPGLYRRILNEAHAVGNHTFNHQNGWMCSADTYMNEVNEAANFIDSNLFRPPYGRIRQKQAELLLKKNKIIMWDVLSYDFDQSVSQRQCLKNVIENIRPGSIVVFHDSFKAFKNLEYVLPKCLDHFKQEGYIFSAIK